MVTAARIVAVFSQVMTTVHRWEVFEARIRVAVPAASDPLRDVRAIAELQSPSGRRHAAPGFWDGEDNWAFRWAPDELGTWKYTFTAGDVLREDAFECVPYEGENRFYLH